MNWVLGLLLFLFGGCRTYHVAAVSAANLAIESTIEADQNIIDAVEPYKMDMDSIMDEVLAVNEDNLVLSQPESLLGNHVADVLLSTANSAVDETVDFAIMNIGGIRKELLPKGNLTLKDAFELIPFDNDIVILNLDYNLMETLFQYMTHNGGWPIAGASYEIENGLPINIKINGEPLKQDRTYRVAMSEYIADGGDKFTFLKFIYRERTGIMIRDALTAHWQKLDSEGLPIRAKVEGRVIKK